MMFENLEDRRLMSATLTNGVLTVTGTAGNDRISVAPKGTDLNVQVGKTKTTFKAADVKSLVVNALAGNDLVDLAKSPVGATVDAGDGNDVVIGTAKADVVNAGKGNDYVFALAGNDSVNGGDGHDFISAGAGNDTVHGNAGNDLLLGDAGDDQLFGDAGNDRIFGGAGNDKVDGGDGTDIAGKQGADTFTKVEKIWR